MLQVTILMVGKTREGFIQEGLDFYQKRLKPLMQLSLKSVREEKEGGGLTPETLKSKEGERLQAQIPPRAWVVALDPKGREFTTEEFAAWLGQREELARPLAFLIGGHWGLSDAGAGRSRRTPGPVPPHPDPRNGPPHPAGAALPGPDHQNGPPLSRLAL